VRHALAKLVAKALHVTCPLVLKPRPVFDAYELDPKLRPLPQGAKVSKLAKPSMRLHRRWVQHTGRKPTYLAEHRRSNILSTRTWRENGTFPQFCVKYDGYKVKKIERYPPYYLNPALIALDMGREKDVVTANIPHLTKLARKMAR
jgi:hypothetical protein